MTQRCRAVALLLLASTGLLAHSHASGLPGAPGRRWHRPSHSLYTQTSDAPLRHRRSLSQNTPVVVDTLALSAFCEQEIAVNLDCLVPENVQPSSPKRYEFEVTTDGPYDMDVALDMLEGDAEIYFQVDVAATGSATPDWRITNLLSASFGDEVIFISASLLKVGKYALFVTAVNKGAEFWVRIQTFSPGRVLDANDSAALESVVTACCAAGCTNVLGSFAASLTAPATAEPFYLCGRLGVHCSPEGRVTHLDLSYGALKCSAADLRPLSSLVQLRRLTLSYNPDITGTFQDILGVVSTMTELTDLSLTSLVELGGLMPADCPVPLGNLQWLNLASTKVGGNIPACLFKNIVYLDLDFCDVEGVIPALPPLAPLGIFRGRASGKTAAKRFTGDLPDYSSAADLRVLLLGNNELTGTINVSAAMDWVDLRDNRLTAVTAVDPESLYYLYLQNNQLSGTVSDDLAVAQSLTVLDLSGNALTGTVPGWDTPAAVVIDLSNNQITGEVPVWIARQEALRTMDLSNNQLTGTLDAFAAAAAAADALPLLQLYLQNNQLTGTLPDDLAKLTLFSHVTSMRTETGYVPVLNALDLSGNELTGMVPEAMLAPIALRQGTTLQVSLADNDIECPSAEVAAQNKLEASDIESLGCVAIGSGSGGGGGGASVGAIVGGLFAALAIIGIIVALFLLYRRRQRARNAGKFALFDHEQEMSMPQM